MSKVSRLNRIYQNMKIRCYEPKSQKFKYYGGRGITVCEEWNNREIIYKGQRGRHSKGFLAFQEWALNNGYNDNLSLDRIDYNGNYEPTNCRWVTQKVQCNNTRRNRLINYKGKTQTLAEWCDELKLDYGKTNHRINTFHWSIERAFEVKENPRFRYITYKGKTQTLKEWCEELGLNPKIVSARINRYKWTIERAFEEKINVEYIRNTRMKAFNQGGGNVQEEEYTAGCEKI